MLYALNNTFMTKRIVSLLHLIIKGVGDEPKVLVLTSLFFLSNTNAQKFNPQFLSKESYALTITSDGNVFVSSKIYLITIFGD